MTQPKQWNSGTHRHRRSSGVKPSTCPDAKPLLRMFRLESMTPFGKPVVPDVYCMLITSSGLMAPLRASSPASGTRGARARSSAYGKTRGSDALVTASKRPDPMSPTTMMRFSVGIWPDMAPIVASSET